MNTNNIKKYAPKARTAFIAAMTKQAAKYGISAKGTEPLEQKGDLALIADRAFPAAIAAPRAALAKQVEQQGFAQVIEQAAYSWFNRLCAIRFMELKGYLDHGRRVLSAASDATNTPQILDDCLDIDLPGLDKQRITELKLDGSKDEELYRELLLAQCHALHQAMPFLFEAIDDKTELLLPDNLTKTDSLIRELVSAIPEEDWQDVEIIGWLYQFYISEKKDQVIGKVVKSEDIPAATQLFTPNWIVQYLVQNSVGRQWLQTYPDSQLKAKMPYYIEPAEQTPEVQAQLAAITPDSIDPLTIKVLDPACGSGHILVEAYKVLKAIYEERGFRSRDIPQLILEHNLFGLDIDDRAGQLAGFALMMLAREDDRRIFGRTIKLNILPLQESSHTDFASLWKALNLTSDWQRGQSQGLFESEQTDLSSNSADNRYQLLKNTLARFTQAKTFGSLIEVPAEDAEPLAELLDQLRQLAREGDVMQKPAAEQLVSFVQQAWVLAQRYDAVVANPPYMGTRNMPPALKEFSKKNFKNSKHDLYAMFFEHATSLLRSSGLNAQIHMHSWMFLGAYQDLRNELLNSNTIIVMAHLGPRAFKEISGEVVQTDAVIVQKISITKYKGTYFRLISGDSEDKRNSLLNHSKSYSDLPQHDFKIIPGHPIAYWLRPAIRAIFEECTSIGNESTSRKGMVTANNEVYVMGWSEVSFKRIGFSFINNEQASKSNIKWVPYLKGGDYRRWYGNQDYIVLWENGGEKIRNTMHPTENRIHATNFNLDYIFKAGITWSDIATSNIGFRYTPQGFIFDAKSPTAFGFKDAMCALGALNSKLTNHLAQVINPTVSFQVGNYDSLPHLKCSDPEKLRAVIEELIEISKKDWQSFETSWDFGKTPLASMNSHSLQAAFDEWSSTCLALTNKSKYLEEENNKIFIEEYDLHDEINPEIEKNEVTLNINPRYRYGNHESNDIISSRYQADTFVDLVSYSVGCIMGRYSLDREGLVYAHAGNQGFAELAADGAYKSFPADDDGILPLTDQEWFSDDATNRFREFVRTVWAGPEGATEQEQSQRLQENLNFVAASLCLHAIKPKSGESALDTIRRYLSTQFYKDHLKTYKKRPIYWLFSSGKHKAFECLVYLHRYNEGTLARMRTEYVIPLTAKLSTHANKLEQDIDASTSTAEKKALEKQLATLHNQQAELATFDEKLRHHADLRITLDLDEGVKENYGKFGDLLAEVKTVTGEK